MSPADDSPCAVPRAACVMTARIRAPVDAIHALEAREPDALGDVIRDHDSEPLGWP